MSLLVSASVGLVALSAVIVVFVGFLYKKGEINETPGSLQFANLKNIPGDDYVDLNASRNILRIGMDRAESTLVGETASTQPLVVGQVVSMNQEAHDFGHG